MSIGKWTNALVSGVNENNLSLANINLDFSLIRVTAPEEYLPLGQAMSLQRRQTAEEGPVHQTARRLGALFSQVAPKTPKLVKAFGQRVSEIMRTPGANPKGSPSDGPFRNFVGIDATSIWASATSGPASISVLLLACMLARKIDDAKVSVALWVQIISLRQAEVRQNAEIDGHFLDASVLASQQRILREDIAAFDASVRSWLSVADQVMVKNRKQLDLILQNLTMPHVLEHGEAPYTKIIATWKNGLTGLEELLEGRPQTISESSLLLALSAWHLYPNLLVLCSEIKKVDFGDKLVPKQAVVTVGLMSNPSQDDAGGFHWSVALSHLKYYGDPVRVEVNDNTRITVQELELITFGALLSHWKVSLEKTSDAATWICRLDDLLAEPFPHGSPTWFVPLARAAKVYLSATGDELEEYQALIKCGRRRSSRILPTSDRELPAFFNLTNPHVMRMLTLPLGREAMIEYVRSISQAVQLQARKSFLAFRHRFVIAESKKALTANIATTLIPHRRLGAKRDREGNRKQIEVHARWISFLQFDHPSNEQELTAFIRDLGTPSTEEVYVLTSSESELVFDETLGYCDPAFHWVNPPSFFNETSPIVQCQPSKIDERHLRCSCFGPLHWKFPRVFEEKVQEPTISPGAWDPFEDDIFAWAHYGHSTEQIIAALSEKGMDPCPSVKQLEEHMKKGDYPLLIKPGVHKIAFVAVRGRLAAIVLCIREEYEKNDDDGYSINQRTTTRVVETIDHKLHLEGNSSSDLATALSSLESHHFNKGSLKTFFDSITIHFDSVTSQIHPLKLGRRPLSPSIVDNLEALCISAEILNQCTSATMPMKISNISLQKGKWFPRGPAISDTVQDFMVKVSRAQSLACICVLESGGTDVDPSYFERAFALSASNSIYVARVLLEDPGVVTPPSSIVRIVGNIGVPGISVIVSPETLKVADAPDDPRAIQHQEYNNRREDSFSSVTLHLSMTDWRVPIPTGTVGLIDQDLFLTEAVVSVHDGGKWYADIDVLGAKTEDFIVPLNLCLCKDRESRALDDMVCIDTFDELLEFPEFDAILRAKGNWAARLAAVCIWRQKNLPALLSIIRDDEEHCWKCIRDHMYDLPPEDFNITSLVID